MALESWLAFVIASAVLLVILGPTILAIGKPGPENRGKTGTDLFFTRLNQAILVNRFYAAASFAHILNCQITTSA